MRLKLLRRVVQERGGVCEVLDIGPSRRLVRDGCIAVMSARDYIAKVVSFARSRYSFHCHINGEYFRGLLLALAACMVCRLFRNRCIVTFHAGATQPFLQGWRRHALHPLYRMIFGLAHAVVCNSEAVKMQLKSFAGNAKIFPIQAFSRQYLQYQPVELNPPLEQFLRSRLPLISSYLCFRDGFFVEVVLDALPRLLKRWPELGLVIVGTGPGQPDFERALASRGFGENVFLAGDMDHDSFMTLLKRSQVHLRTPVTDGVSATVLEALWLRVPVVASENGLRPRSTMTYRGDDPAHLAQQLDWTLTHHAQVAAAIPGIVVPDTAAAEVDLIAGIESTQLTEQPHMP
jgi:glycosyltransferase involved in cell wall biosynthesis